MTECPKCECPFLDVSATGASAKPWKDSEGWHEGWVWNRQWTCRACEWQTMETERKSLVTK